MTATVRIVSRVFFDINFATFSIPLENQWGNLQQFNARAKTIYPYCDGKSTKKALL
jgi:hypothetical protein